MITKPSTSVASPQSYWWSLGVNSLLVSSKVEVNGVWVELIDLILLGKDFVSRSNTELLSYFNSSFLSFPFEQHLQIAQEFVFKFWETKRFAIFFGQVQRKPVQCGAGFLSKASQLPHPVTIPNPTLIPFTVPYLIPRHVSYIPYPIAPPIPLIHPTPSPRRFCLQRRAGVRSDTWPGRR